MEDSAILFQNPEGTIFLVDIPRSIALAQELSPVESSNFQEVTWQKKDIPKRVLLSNEPLETPYPSTEPKSDTARAKVLRGIPESERTYHGNIIEPLVQKGVSELQEGYQEGQPWCLPRQIVREDASKTASSLALSHKPPLNKKRKWEEEAAARADWLWRHQGNFAPGQSGHNATLSEKLGDDQSEPPLILSSTCNNTFETFGDLKDIIVRNPSSDPATVMTCDFDNTHQSVENMPAERKQAASYNAFHVPPQSHFLIYTIPMVKLPARQSNPISRLSPDRKFNLILLDPPWPNKSVRRSGHYGTQTYTEMDLLTQRLQDILQTHLHGPSKRSIAAIWITNSPNVRRAAYDAIHGAGLSVCEEWVWIKTTVHGEPVSPVDALWRKPYEILVIGERVHRQDGDSKVASVGLPEGNDAITRRVIAAVPDVHSRKPALKEIFEKIFFAERYEALEVFARNLTAGWWAVGNEVLKFNAEEWWA